MSPLSSSRLSAAILPGRIVWGLRERWRERIVVHGERAVSPEAPPGAWQPAVAALDAMLQEHAGRKLELTLALSGHFARCLVLPWPAEVGEQAEADAYAAHQLRQVFGDAAEGWDVSLDSEARGARRLACGVDRELLDALRGAAKARGARVASIQPLIVSIFNQCRRAIDAQPALFFVAEPGRYCSAWLDHGQWQTLRHGRLASDAAHELCEALAREQALFGDAARRVLVYAPEHGELGVENMPGLRRIGPAAGTPAYVHGRLH